MRRAAKAFVVIAMLSAGPRGLAQSTATVWTRLQKPPFDSKKSAFAEDITLTRDRLRITFVQGTIQFAKPLRGRYFAAAFKGRGWLRVTPPNPIEARQLKYLGGSSPLKIAFTQAVVSFTDNTYSEVSGQVRWVTAEGHSLGRLYRSRQRKREQDDAGVLPRLFQAFLSTNPARNNFFYAELKTHKGWVIARYDSARIEEVYVGRWYQGNYHQYGTYDDWKRETWTSFPSGNQNPLLVDEHPRAKLVYGIPQTRIDATVTTGAKLTADAELRLRLRQSGERVLLFRLDANLRLSSVRDEAGRKLTFFQPPRHAFFGQTHGDYVAVALPEATRAGRTMTLDFRYSGGRSLDASPSLWGAPVFVRGDFDWYPRSMSSVLRSKFTLIFHTPKRFQLVASGNLVNRKTVGAEMVTTWKSPGAVPVAGFCFASFYVHRYKFGSTGLRLYAESDSSWGFPVHGLFAEATLEAGNVIRLLDKYFGRYPYRGLSLVLYSSTARQGWPMLAYGSGPSTIASQWWGQGVRAKTYHDHWLISSLDYWSGLLYLELRWSPGVYVRWLAHRRRSEWVQTACGFIPFRLSTRDLSKLGPLWLGGRLASSRMPAGAAQSLIEEKGARILDMLRMMLWDPGSRDPDHRFEAMLRDFERRFAGRAVSTLDFETIVEKHMTKAMDLNGDHRMSWFFREYVFGTGTPHYALAYRASPLQDGRWVVDASLTRTGVPSNWEDLLPIYVRLKKQRMELVQVKVAAPKVRFQFTVRGKPSKVSLDDEARALRAVPDKEPASAVP
jgi:hypothetical protein